MILAHAASGTGAPAVLLHGLGLSRALFDPLLPALEPAARLIRFDLRGHGASAAPDPATPFSHHLDVLETMDALALERVDLVGLSLGGGVAIDLALARPDRVRRLVLLAPVLSGWAWSAAWIAAFRTIRAVGRESGPRAALEAWHAHDLFKTARENPRSAEALDRLIHDDDGRRWILRDPSRPLEPPATDRLARLRASTHVLVGERDLPDFLAIAETLATHVPAVRLLVVAGAGHLLPLEATDVTARAVAVGLASDVPPELRKGA